jgi:hypothetical protein
MAQNLKSDVKSDVKSLLEAGLGFIALHIPAIVNFSLLGVTLFNLWTNQSRWVGIASAPTLFFVGFNIGVSSAGRNSLKRHSLWIELDDRLDKIMKEKNMENARITVGIQVEKQDSEQKDSERKKEVNADWVQ